MLRNTNATESAPTVQIDITDCHSLADALKQRTAEAHARAERHPFQAGFVRGETSRENYISWLQQMSPIWRALDDALLETSSKDPRFAEIHRPHHVHHPRVAADLQFLGRSIEPDAVVPATQRFATTIQNALAHDSVRLLGFWYVLEGSTNGGRYIAKALAKKLSIPGPQGLTSFDPHGEEQRPRWQQWRNALDAQAFSQAEADAVIESASEAFDAVYEIMEDLQSIRLEPSPAN